MERRRYNRLYGYDYSRTGGYFLTLCAYNRQKLFSEEVIFPDGWYPETDRMQYGEVSDSLVGAHPCVRPAERLKNNGIYVGKHNAVTMIEKWIHKIPETFKNVKIDYYVIMPDHVHLILFMCNERDAHMGAPQQINGEDGFADVCDHENNVYVYDIMKWFKTMTTNEYIRLVKQNVLPPFKKHVWQRDYIDRVIRNSDELYEIRKYIKQNPEKMMYDMD